MTSVSLYKIKLAEVIGFIILNLVANANGFGANLIYINFKELFYLPLVWKMGICGIKGIKARLEIPICFCKIYVCFKLLFEPSASYDLEPYILRKNKL